MSRETGIEKRRRIALQTGVTHLASEFKYMCKKRPGRIGVVAEGDSWFSYPRKWIIFGEGSNVIHHFSKKISKTNTVNLLQLASNGDEAVTMTTGKQFSKLYKVLKTNQDSIRLILFSGGGNDIVGKRDMLPLLNEFEDGFGYLDCINHTRLENKMKAIILAYRRLADMCEDIVPHAKIITHTYDIAKPWDQGATFFWGLIKTKPWIYPYLMKRNIPKELHLPICEYMLKTFGKNLIDMTNDPVFSERLVVVDTQGTLRSGSKADWKNEIHPNEKGFKKIFKKIYKTCCIHEPALPR